jgi:hypothetical protein
VSKQSFHTNKQLIRVAVLIYSLLAFIVGENRPIVAGQKAPNTSSGWETIYFQGINERARIGNLGKLRAATLGKSDLELRVWIGFGPVALKGFVINRRGAAWSATYLRSISPSVARSEYQKKLGPPKSGWESFWERLIEQGVLRLPGSPKSDWVDGESIVVEMKTAGKYRTYMYDHPQHQDSPEASKIIAIVETIRNEFDIPK